MQFDIIIKHILGPRSAIVNQPNLKIYNQWRNAQFLRA